MQRLLPLPLPLPLALTLTLPLTLTLTLPLKELVQRYYVPLLRHKAAKVASS